MNRAIHFYAR